eukprot:TRINITY_DN10113_c0_g1_i1.p1 TRINITY_DN10113_c0_g1~~TRINITY_DN10113_c0_g1_i1.p1  ORF type:complete len:353 (+),score=47.30 TRINITY_DN10113_c0_g1_i1:134-1192(+)
MVNADTSRDVPFQGVADDVTLRRDGSHFEDSDLDLEANILKSTIPRVEWHSLILAPRGTVGWAVKSDGLKHVDIDAELVWPGERFPRVGASCNLPGYSESMANVPESTGDMHFVPHGCNHHLDTRVNIDTESSAGGVSSQTLESTKSSSGSNGSTREVSAESDGTYPAGDDESVLEVQVREAPALPDAAYAAEDDEAVPEVWVREVSALSDGTYPAGDDESVLEVQVRDAPASPDADCQAEDEEAVLEVSVREVSVQFDATYPAAGEAMPEVQGRSAQIGGVGQDIHALPLTAAEVSSNRRRVSATPQSSLYNVFDRLNQIQPDVAFVLSGSGLLACAVWWFSLVMFPDSRM